MIVRFGNAVSQKQMIAKTLSRTERRRIRWAIRLIDRKKYPFNQERADFMKKRTQIFSMLLALLLTLTCLPMSAVALTTAPITEQPLSEDLLYEKGK